MLSDKIISNTIYNSIGRFWAILAAFFLTPYIIHRIGVERFGIWAIAGVVTGYFGLFDFGVGMSFVKYIAEFYAKKDYEKINRVVNSSLIFYFLFALVLIIAAFLLMGRLIWLIRIPPRLYGETLFVFLAGIAIFSASTFLSVFGAIQGGLQRMDISNKAAMAITVPNVIGVIFFLENGYGLPGLIINNAITLAIGSVVNIVIAFKILPELRINPLFFDREILKKMFHYGYKLQVSRLANLVSFQTNNILIAYFLGIGLVTHYQLGSSLLQQARQMLLPLVSALVPAVSEIEAQKKTDYLRELYMRGSKWLIAIATPVLCFMIAEASVIMLAWMGNGYARSAFVIQVLAFGYFAATVTGIASSITAGVARTDLDMKFGILMAALNIFLSVVLIVKMGLIGAAVGTTLSLTAASFFYMKVFSDDVIGMVLRNYMKLFCKPFLSCIAPVLTILVMQYYFQKMAPAGSRMINLSILILNGLLFAVVYVICMSLTKYFDAYDMELIKKRILFLK